MADLFSHPDSQSGNFFTQCGFKGEPSEPDRAAFSQTLEVPDTGRYRVTVSMQGAKALFGQRRNLISPAPGKTLSYYACLTEYMPPMSASVNRDKLLYATAIGGSVRIEKAEKANARTVFIAGDSTVADQYTRTDYYPADSYCGWGQMLSAFLPEDAVCNMAHSGLTSRCFREDGHFDIVKKYMRSGDLMLIQFGHNDQKRRYLQADQQYPVYLERICREVMALGGQPVLVSPISRVPGKDAAGYFDLLYDHAEANRILAEKLGIPFIDLHKYSFDLFVSMGESCRTLFMDMTHSNDPGAFRVAGFIAGELKRLGLVKPVFPDGGFVTSDTEKVPPAAPGAPMKGDYVDVEGYDKELITAAVARGLLDPCVLHMHPEEKLTRGAFIQLLFKKTHMSGGTTDGVAPYKDIKPREFDASFAVTCKQKGLVTGEYLRPDDLITSEEANGMMEKCGLTCRIGGEYAEKYKVIEAFMKE